jgi:hypothetical protein
MVCLKPNKKKTKIIQFDSNYQDNALFQFVL